MGSSEFLQALLSTKDRSYERNFSLKTKLLLNFCKIFFPHYIERAAKSRSKLKEEIRREVKKYHPDVIIEIGSGHSTDYIEMLEKGKVKKVAQVDREKIVNSSHPRYEFIQGDITRQNVWNKLSKMKSKRGLIVAEGVFSYLNDKEFDFVVENVHKIAKKKYSLLAHEPIRPISFSRKIISLFIGKTYRRFNSAIQIENYYKSRGLKIMFLEISKWQLIYRVYC